MEWEHAKNYLIVFFIILNIGLGSLLFLEDRRYTVSAEQDRLINTLLAQNNIGMYTLPIRRFPPMRPMDITGFYYDKDAIVGIFFDNIDDVIQSYRFGGYSFQYGSASLIIVDGFIFYDNPYGLYSTPSVARTPNAVTRDSAILQAGVFINTHFPSFVLDRDFRDGDGIRLIFVEEYRGYVIHSNHIEFLVTDIGIQQVEMQYGQILGFSGTSRMIFSPDEALFAFLQRVRHITQDTPMIITQMDLVYFQEYVSDQPTAYPAAPFYRIFTQCSGERPFLINAFTNVIID